MYIVPGTERILKIKPKSVASELSAQDQLFQIKNLSDPKFEEWINVATSSNKISVVDAIEDAEVDRYIDQNYDKESLVGNIWMLGKVEEDRSFYLQTGETLNKTNSNSIFSDYDCVASNGYLEEGAFNLINRSSPENEFHSHGVNVNYNQVGLLDKGLGFNGTTSVVSFNDGPMPTITTKLSVKILMKQTVVGVNSIFGSHDTGFFISIDGTELSVSSSVLNFLATIDVTGKISSDEFFLLDFVYDGTQTDGDVGIQNSKRLKFYINGEQQSLTFMGDVPATYPAVGAAFEFGAAGFSFAGVLDETRVVIGRAETSNEVSWRYDQWFNQENYWDISVQPIISSIEYVTNGTWLITGTGFKPEVSNPTGTIADIAFSILSTSDTEVLIRQDSSTPVGEQTLIIINSDNESFSFNIDVPDINAPEWVSGYPKTDFVYMNYIDFLVEINENGKGYYVVLPSDSTAPTSLQVKSGTDADNNPVNSGDYDLEANVEIKVTIKDVSSEQKYDIYFVAEDEVNLQDEPVKLTVKTSSKIPINPKKPGCTYYDLVIPSKDSELDFIVSDIKKLYRDIVLPDMKQNRP